MFTCTQNFKKKPKKNPKQDNLAQKKSVYIQDFGGELGELYSIRGACLRKIRISEYEMSLSTDPGFVLGG